MAIERASGYLSLIFIGVSRRKEQVLSCWNLLVIWVVRFSIETHCKICQAETQFVGLQFDAFKQEKFYLQSNQNSVDDTCKAKRFKHYLFSNKIFYVFVFIFINQINWNKWLHALKHRWSNDTKKKHKCTRTHTHIR